MATEVTLQPIERFDLDAAILFADILLVPQAMGMKLWFEPGEGPRLSPPVKDNDLAFLENARPADDTLSPVYETVKRVRQALPAEKALIGFAGAPWTVATYMLAGQGTKDPSALRSYAYKNPDLFDRLIEGLIETTTHYLSRQVEAGADAIMLFDSWAAGLPEDFFRQYCAEPMIRIAGHLKDTYGTPVIAFPRGAGPMAEVVAQSDMIAGVSIDNGMPAAWAAENLSPHGAVQGGFDQLLLIDGTEEQIRAEADRLLDAFEGKPYIFNLGHGFTPQTSPERVAALVNYIRHR